MLPVLTSPTRFPPNKEPWPSFNGWDFFPAAFNCPHEVERLGGLGTRGKTVCGLSRIQSKSDCVIYSVGIHHESSFEASLLEHTPGCRLWGYDPRMNGLGSQVQDVPALLQRTHFEPIGLADKDAHGPDDRHKTYTLDSLLDLNGHAFVDILKIDLEGWEFEVLEAIVRP